MPGTRNFQESVTVINLEKKINIVITVTKTNQHNVDVSRWCNILLEGQRVKVLGNY